MLLRGSGIAAAALVAAVVATVPAGADPSGDLMGMLPAGYSSDSCEPADSTGALAAVPCRENSLPGGPTVATYWLFGDDSALQHAFTDYLGRADWAAAVCPGMQSSEPTVVLGPDGDRYGLIACGRGTGTDWQVRDGAVAWTHDAAHFLGVAYVGYQGQAFPASLYDWTRGHMQSRS